MKIVNRKDFLSLPSGTLYSNYRPCAFDGLSIKLDSWVESNDFIYQDLIGNVRCSGSDEYVDILSDAEDKGTPFNLDFDCAGRDGSFDDNALYAIYEPQDIIGLIQTLQQTAQAVYAQKHEQPQP